MLTIGKLKSTILSSSVFSGTIPAASILVTKMQCLVFLCYLSRLISALMQISFFVRKLSSSLVNLAPTIAQPATNCNTRFFECKLEYGLVLTTY